MKLKGLIVALLLTAAAAAQGQAPQKGQKVTVVDDESCGCELFFIDGIQTTQRDGLFGFKREDGTEIVPPTYMFVDQFHDDYCIVYHSYDSCGLIDREGRVVVPVEYAEINYPTDGMIRVRKGDLYGFYDTTGRQRISFQYRTASGFNEGVAAVIVDFDSSTVGYGYIDKDNRMALPAIYEYAYPFEEGYAIVKRYDRFGMIDHSGKEVLPCKYVELTPMHDGTFLAVDALSENAALFNNKFRQLTPFVYEKALSYSEGYYFMQRDGKRTFLGRDGKERFGTFDNASGFIDGYSWVERGGKYGIISSRGKTVLPIEYDNSGYRSMEYIYSEGLAMVEKEGRYGFVDKQGKVVIPLIYQSAQHCTEGLIPVQQNDFWGFIDKEGKTVIPFVFDAASFFQYERAEVVYNGETFKINPDGDCVKNCRNYPKTVKRLF